eukprot:26150-Hanusia_phi.AAC.2
MNTGTCLGPGPPRVPIRLQAGGPIRGHGWGGPTLSEPPGGRPAPARPVTPGRKCRRRTPAPG